MADHLKSPFWLLLYLAAVIGITFIHESSWLGLLLGLALLAAGKTAWRVLRRTLLSVLAFNMSVSLGYVVMAHWQANFHADYLLLVNIRVVLLVFLGFWLVDRIDLLAALALFPLLRLIATLAISQIKTFERILRDFRLAFQSRNLRPPRLLDQSRHAAAQVHTLLDKSLASASEAAMAMRSRGTFND